MATQVKVNRGFLVKDAPYGYFFTDVEVHDGSAKAGQAISFILGACMMVICFGLLVLPTLAFGAPFNAIRMGGAALLGAAGFYLLWFSSRGLRSELQVDLTEKEIRAVVTNKTRAPSIVGLYPFSEIEAFEVRPVPGADHHQLIALRKGGQEAVQIAYGAPERLDPYRMRLQNDIFG